MNFFYLSRGGKFRLREKIIAYKIAFNPASV